MIRNSKKNRSISYEDLVTDLEVKVSKSDKTENSAIKRIYFLNINLKEEEVGYICFGCLYCFFLFPH